jgi:hypothetical protein
MIFQTKHAAHNGLVAGPKAFTQHSELVRNLLIWLETNFPIFSECALVLRENQSGFDSAIPWFESRRPSQPVRSPCEADKERLKSLSVSAQCLEVWLTNDLILT